MALVSSGLSFIAIICLLTKYPLMDLDSLAAVRFFLCVLVFRFSELCWCSASPRCCTLAGEARRSRWNWAGEPDWGAGRWDCTWTRRCKLRSAARPTQTSPTCLWRRGRTGEAFLFHFFSQFVSNNWNHNCVFPSLCRESCEPARLPQQMSHAQCLTSGCLSLQGGAEDAALEAQPIYYQALVLHRWVTLVFMMQSLPVTVLQICSCEFSKWGQANPDINVNCN